MTPSVFFYLQANQSSHHSPNEKAHLLCSDNSPIEQAEPPDTSDSLKPADSAEWYDNVTKPADTVVNMGPPTGDGDKGKQARKGSLMRQDAQKDVTTPPIASDQPPPYPLAVINKRHGPTGDSEERESKI